jgi:hypothetical protein
VLPWVDLIESLSNNNKGIADFNKAFKNLTWLCFRSDTIYP